ncbi:MAG: tetratricopeptide repeat protein, partial [Bacteroidota bacterium]
MNTTYRAGLLAIILIIFTGPLFAQSAGADDLVRADKQFDLYAYNLALRTYDEVLQKEPNNAHALARMGDCNFQLNKPDAALEYYQRATQLRDAEPEATLHYGIALMQTGDYIGAKKQFRLYSDNGHQTVGDHYLSMCDYAIQTSKKDINYTARNEPSNTDAADYSPAFYGSRLAFNSARTDITRKMQSKSNADWTGSAYNQLFVTQRNPEGGFLQKPVFLHSDLQNAFNEGPVSFSGDGKKVAFCRNNFINGTRQIADKGISMSLYTADVDANGVWSNVKAFPFNGSDYATGFPSLSADGKTLLFSSNQDGGYGGWDIYVSNLSSSGWSTPRNLGAPLNTPGNEVTPFYDGKYLYFSSDWHEGLGGLDVFRAELGQAEVKNIYQLGAGINSSRDDYGFIYNSDQNIGYLTSNRPGGRGNEDIWQINKKIVDAPETTAATAAKGGVAPQTYSTIQSVAAEPNSGYNHLLVTDDQGKPLNNVEVDFLDCGCGTGRTDGTGKYYFEALSRPVDCHVGLTREGYQDASIALYSFGQQNVLVALTKDKRQEYVGKVLDLRTKDPLYSVIVQFQIPGTDRLIQTSTDNDGRYSVFVETGVAYEMLYTKEGYADAT